jgi:hypothetical protein
VCTASVRTLWSRSSAPTTPAHGQREEVAPEHVRLAPQANTKLIEPADVIEVMASWPGGRVPLDGGSTAP